MEASLRVSGDTNFLLAESANGVESFTITKTGDRVTVSLPGSGPRLAPGTYELVVEWKRNGETVYSTKNDFYVGYDFWF